MDEKNASPYLPALKVELLPIEAVKPYDNNPRRHPPEQLSKLMRSIREYGFTVPLLVDENNVILAGHGRYVAAKELGIKHLPVIRLTHLTPAQKRAFRIADNRLVMEGDWDLDALSRELNALLDMDFDISLTMLDEKEADYFIRYLKAHEEGRKLDPYYEWESAGMPEYDDDVVKPFRTLHIHFQNEDAVKDFERRMGIELTDKQKTLWWPPKKRINRNDYRYEVVETDESEG